MAEYATMAFGADFKKDMSTIPLDKFNEQMTIAMGNLVNKITTTTKTFQGGNWSILSHSSSVIENRLLVTVILHR